MINNCIKIGWVLSFTAFAFAVQAEPTTGQVLGSMIANETVLVETNGAQLSITDSDYALYSGDKIITSADSVAGVRLEGDGGVYLAPESVASVGGVAGDYRISLEKGGMRFWFKNGVVFKVLAAGQIIESAGFRPVAGTTDARTSGIVILDKEGRPEIQALQGNLTVKNPNTGQYQMIKVGESRRLGKNGEFIRVVDPGGVTEEEERRRAIWWWIGGGALVAAALASQDDDDGPAGSPAK